jgi:hypothetical protein
VHRSGAQPTGLSGFGARLGVLAVIGPLLGACGSSSVGFGPGAAANPAPGKDACRLATPAELEHVTGMPVQPGQHNEFPSYCSWEAQAQNSYQVTPVSTYQGIQVSYVPRANFELYAEQINQPQQGETVRSISGLGDAALVHSYATTSVLVRKEDRVISVAVSTRPAPPGDIRAEQAVARLLLSRI